MLLSLGATPAKFRTRHGLCHSSSLLYNIGVREEDFDSLTTFYIVMQYENDKIGRY